MSFEIWAEKYRPKMLDEVIGQKHIMKRLKGFVEKKNIPHMLFAGPAGCGKTTTAICIAHELYGTGWKRNYLELNASVTPDTPILIRKEGKIIRTNFGKLANYYFKDDASKYAKVNSVEIMTVDKNKKVKFSPIGLISRHKVGNIAKINYEGGFVKTSLNHSVIVLDKNGNLISKQVSELKDRDLLITFKDILKGGFNTELDIGKFKPFDKMRNGITRTNSRTRNIPSKMFLDKEISWLFGLYLAEGCINFKKGTDSCGQIIFSLGYPNEIKIAERVAELFDKYFNLPAKFERGFSGFDRSRNSSVNVRVFNTQLARFFANNFYDGSKAKNALSKKMPDFIFNTVLENKISFLQGYMGDATGEWEEFVRYSSRSNENLIDTSWLGRLCGLDTSCFKGEARIVWKLPKFSYIKTEFIPSDMLINLLENIDEKVGFNWRYLLRHQLYHKKCKRMSKHIAKKILEKLDKKKLPQKELKKIENVLRFIDSPLSVVEIKKIDIEKYDDYVYDVSVPESEMFWGGSVPILLHNSDERGINVIRLKVKDFARTRPIGANYKIICLDEADALTQEAQQALRRTMENYTSSCRFILVCNYSSHIIEPIQSRCAVFRFRSHTKEDVVEYLKRIADSEKLDVDGSGYDAILELSGGDLRKASNLLQTASMEEKIDEKTIYDVAAQAAPADVKKMMEEALAKNFIESRKSLQDLLFKQGISGEDIIREISKQVYNLQLSDKEKIELIEKVGECEFRLDQGANEQIQLEALLAKFAMFGK